MFIKRLLTSGRSGNDNALLAGFDWRAYLSRYPDLRAAGVVDEAAARRHWLEHGAAEGRWGAAESYPPRRALRCPIVDSLFMRSWGDVVCWDDAGSGIVLAHLDSDVRAGRDVFLGPEFSRIRSFLYNDRLPYPEACQRCCCLRTLAEHTSAPVDRREMRVLQIEPSYNCALDCPGCVRRSVRHLAPQPHNVDPALLEIVLNDLVETGIRVHSVSFLGHGEPLMHPRLAELVSMVKASYPGSYLAIGTNGNFPFSPALVEAGVDELVVAIDGVDQASYEQYRVGGSFARALGFLRDAAENRALRRWPLRLIWRYVIFSHNDSPEQLVRAQELATSVGVDRLDFIFTHNGPRSERVERESHIPVMPGSLEVRCERHEPDPSDLQRRLVVARRLAAVGETSAAHDLVRSVERNLERCCSDGQDLSPAHSVVRKDLKRVAAELGDVPGVLGRGA
jgi:pyruvate-formate lyase-activating enzyme